MVVKHFVFVEIIAPTSSGVKFQSLKNRAFYLVNQHVALPFYRVFITLAIAKCRLTKPFFVFSVIFIVCL